MASVNKVILIGNVGQGTSMRYLPNGSAKVEFSLAVNSRKKQGDEWVDQTDWFNIGVFDKYAETMAQYIVKGKQLFVEGRMSRRTWKDDNDQWHERTEVIANNIMLLGSRGDADQGRSNQYDEDLPFR